MIFSIDQSLTCTGVCVMNEINGEYYTFTIKPKKIRGVERLNFIKKEIEYELFKLLQIKYTSISEYTYINKKNKIHELILFNVNKPIIGILEGYSYGSTGRTFELGELGAIIKMLFYQYKIELITVPPTKWKKQVIGKGNANKSKVRWELEKQYKQTFKTQDEADAYAMSLWWRQTNEK